MEQKFLDNSSDLYEFINLSIQDISSQNENYLFQL
jgi:hypothetical protein